MGYSIEITWKNVHYIFSASLFQLCQHWNLYPQLSRLQYILDARSVSLLVSKNCSKGALENCPLIHTFPSCHILYVFPLCSKLSKSTLSWSAPHSRVSAEEAESPFKRKYWLFMYFHSCFSIKWTYCFSVYVSSCPTFFHPWTEWMPLFLKYLVVCPF